MAILVTGGAGYIGSHAVAELLSQGEHVVVVDNLSTGHRQAILTDSFYEGDIRDPELLDSVFRSHSIEAVMHFAAHSLVGESVSEPLKYYDNNVVAAQRLLTKMREYGVDKIIFSSTAATYGEPVRSPIEETDPTNPTSPYGDTKLAIEHMLRWCERAYGIQSVSLRYFNAAGADLSHEIGEDHSPESHLIPIVMQVALGQRDFISIFGDDYPTTDGTCIRDYIHVKDLAHAHWLALQKLRQHKGSNVYNLGNGAGFSVLEVIEKARQITGHPIPSRVEQRRAGDPAILVASAEKAQSELKWKPIYTDLSDIIHDAWQWHKEHPNGYSTQL